MGGKDGDRFGRSLTVIFTRFQSLGCWGLAVVHSADPGYVNVYRVDNPKASFIQLGNSLSGGKAGDKFGRSVLFSPHFNLLAIGAN